MDYEEDDSGSTPGEHTFKRRRITQACDACNKKKIKCDGAKPTCGNCNKLQIECSYSRGAKKRGPRAGYIESLERRLSEMEALLRPLGILDQADQDAELHPDPRHDVSGGPLPMASDFAQDRDPWRSNFAGSTNSNPEAVVTSRVNAALRLHDGHDDLVNDLRPPALEPDERERMLLIDTYFSINFDMMNVLHKKTTMLKVHHLNQLLANAIFTLAVNYLSASEQRRLRDEKGLTAAVFYERARNLLDLHLDALTLDTVCATLLMTSYTISVGNGAAAWMLSGLAIRIAQELKCNVEPDTAEGFVNYLETMDWVELETRRRLWLFCYYNDLVISNIVRGVCIIKGSDCRLYMPLCEKFYQELEPGTKIPLSEIRPDDTMKTDEAISDPRIKWERAPGFETHSDAKHLLMSYCSPDLTVMRKVFALLPPNQSYAAFSIVIYSIFNDIMNLRCNKSQRYTHARPLALYNSGTAIYEEKSNDKLQYEERMRELNGSLEEWYQFLPLLLTSLKTDDMIAYAEYAWPSDGPWGYLHHKRTIQEQERDRRRHHSFTKSNAALNDDPKGADQQMQNDSDPQVDSMMPSPTVLVPPKEWVITRVAVISHMTFYGIKMLMFRQELFETLEAGFWWHEHRRRTIVFPVGRKTIPFTYDDTAKPDPLKSLNVLVDAPLQQNENIPIFITRAAESVTAWLELGYCQGVRMDDLSALQIHLAGQAALIHLLNVDILERRSTYQEAVYRSHDGAVAPSPDVDAFGRVLSAGDHDTLERAHRYLDMTLAFLKDYGRRRESGLILHRFLHRAETRVRGRQSRYDTAAPPTYSWGSSYGEDSVPASPQGGSSATGASFSASVLSGFDRHPTYHNTPSSCEHPHTTATSGYPFPSHSTSFRSAPLLATSHSAGAAYLASTASQSQYQSHKSGDNLRLPMAPDGKPHVPAWFHSFAQLHVPLQEAVSHPDRLPSSPYAISGHARNLNEGLGVLHGPPLDGVYHPSSSAS